MISVPQVMISSTFFDLKQIRANLARFLSDEVGYRPLISEWPSFPVDPNVDTIENCRRRVELEADILLLIIGGRYGYVDSRSAKSVTNLEYLAARAKGIPIYTFVAKQVLALLPVWKANKGADFSSVVDDPRVFAFIEEIRDVHKVWMSEFDLAEEIVTALRWRLAALALQGARFVRKTHDDREYATVSQLQGPALRLALERPAHWEYLLFAEVLIQELAIRRALSERKRLGLSFGAYDWVSDQNIRGWLHARGAELKGLLHAFDVLVNEEFRRAIGPPGQPGDLGLIIFTARSLATLYQEAIEWSLRVRRTTGEEGMEEVVDALQSFSDDLLSKIDGFGPGILQKLEEAKAAVARGEPGKAVIVLAPNLTGGECFSAAFTKLIDRAKERQGGR